MPTTHARASQKATRKSVSLVDRKLELLQPQNRRENCFVSMNHPTRSTGEQAHRGQQQHENAGSAQPLSSFGFLPNSGTGGPPVQPPWGHSLSLAGAAPMLQQNQLSLAIGNNASPQWSHQQHAAIANPSHGVPQNILQIILNVQQEQGNNPPPVNFQQPIAPPMASSVGEPNQLLAAIQQLAQPPASHSPFSQAPQGFPQALQQAQETPQQQVSRGLLACIMALQGAAPAPPPPAATVTPQLLQQLVLCAAQYPQQATNQVNPAPSMTSLGVPFAGLVVGNPAAAHAGMEQQHVTTDAIHEIDWSNNCKETTSFPMKLHKILQNDKEFGQCIAWNPDGKTWKILKQREFEKTVIPRFFRHTRYASFMRQVNGWNFTRVIGGPYRGSYRHELFRRDDPQLCTYMNRIRKSDHDVTSNNTIQEQNNGTSAGANNTSSASLPTVAQQQSTLFRGSAQGNTHHNDPLISSGSTSPSASGYTSGSSGQQHQAQQLSSNGLDSVQLILSMLAAQHRTTVNSSGTAQHGNRPSAAALNEGDRAAQILAFLGQQHTADGVNTLPPIAANPHG